MSEAARSVKHYVSDCLAERYPYDPLKGFAGRCLQDAGKVFRGFLPGTIETLLESLSDPTKLDTERAKAVHHLYAYSASQEMKIELVRKGVISVIVSILNRESIPVILEHQCFLLLRSLSIIPQGCYGVTFGGGLAAALSRAAKPSDNTHKSQGMDPKEAALHTILQIVSDVAGVHWLLYPEDYKVFILADVEYPCATVANAKDVFEALADVLANEPIVTRSALHAINSLVHMTALRGCVEVCIRNTECILDVLATILTAVARAEVKVEDLPTERLLFLERLCEILWNIALVEEGLVSLEKRHVSDSLFLLFDTFRHVILPESFPLQRTLTGSVSAMYKLLDVKQSSLKLFRDGATRIEALLIYLHDLNKVIDEAEMDKKRSNLFAARGAAKNTISALRFAMEFKQARNTSRIFFEKVTQENADAYHRV